MGASDAIARRAWAVIVAWVVIAGLAAPLAAKLNNVLQTKEESYLPPNVESVRAEKALGGGSKAQPDAVIVVDGVNVSLESYWRLRGPWRGIDWGNATHISWISILNGIYSEAYNESLRGVNQTLQGLEGYERLWNATLQASEGLEKLALLLNATAKSLAGADRAYKGYWSAAQSLARAKPGLERLLAAVTALCQGTPRAYGALLFDVARAEYLIENLTNAYERGYLTKADVERVVQASNMSAAGIPPLDPMVVVEVFNLTMKAGGPSFFTNTLAAWEAYAILNATMPPQTSRYLEALYHRVSEKLAGEPSLRDLASQGTHGLREALGIALNTTASEAAPAAVDYGWALANETKSPIVGWAVEAYARAGCSPNATTEALTYAMYKQLVSNKMNPEVAAFIARGVARGNLTKEAVARVSLKVVAATAAKAGAPPVLLEAINSSEAAAILLRFDPNATGALESNATLARLAAARLLEERHDGMEVEPQVLEALAAGESPEELAIKLVEAKAPPEARPLLTLFKEKGVPRTREELAEMAAPLMVEAAVKRGIPKAQAEMAVEAAVKVFLGEENLTGAASSLARKALEAAWGEVLKNIEGSMVSKDHRAFTVILFNVTYGQAKRIEGEIGNATAKTGFTGARVVGTGGVIVDHDMEESAIKSVERSDRVSMALVFIILAIVLESIVAVFLPFTGIGLGLATALGAAYLLAKGGALTITDVSRSIMFSTGLGLGIDYATLISRRFREEYARLGDKRRAAAAALRLSARPVVAGATTAAIGFGSLALAWDFPFLKSIGLSVPLAIGFVVAASLTFIPALLAIVGSSNALWWPVGAKPRGTGRGARALGRLVSRRAAAAALVAIVVVAAVPAIYEHATFKGSHDLTLMMPEGTESLEGLKIINSRFDPGVLYPLYVVPSNASSAKAIADAVASLSCVSKAVVENTSSGTRYVLVIPSVVPMSRAGVSCARQVREAAHKIDPGSLVGGAAAMSLDVEDLLNARFYHRVLPAAVVLMFISMLVAYGGAVAALAAVAVVTLAAEYSIGLTVFYYQSIKGMPVVWFLPIVVFTAILGVGMDYNSFSISRAAEECLKRCDSKAIEESVSKVAILVLGLATIMAGAYGGLTLSSTPHMRMMGASLLLGVLFAGILASTALTPPLIALLGKTAWWPWGPKAEAAEEGG